MSLLAHRVRMECNDVRPCCEFYIDLVRVRRSPGEPSRTSLHCTAHNRLYHDTPQCCTLTVVRSGANVTRKACSSTWSSAAQHDDGSQ